MSVVEVKGASVDASSKAGYTRTREQLQVSLGEWLCVTVFTHECVSRFAVSESGKMLSSCDRLQTRCVLSPACASAPLLPQH